MLNPHPRFALRVLLATNGCILLSGAMLAPIYALFVEEIGGDLLDASMAGAAFAFGAGFTVLMFGKIADTFQSPRKVMALGYLIMAIGYVLLIRVGGMMSLLLCQILIGFGEAVYSPSFDALYSLNLDTTKRASQWGAWESMNYFATGIGAVIGGLIVKSFGFDALFICMAVLTATSAVYVLALPKDALQNPFHS